jgi:hypothetical protein
LLAADPTQAGHFTVAVLNSTGSVFLPYTTTDNGNTWNAGTPLSDNSSTTKFKAAINYSSDGVLGLMWRSNASPVAGPYNVFAAISQDEGQSFSKPLQINVTPSAAPDPVRGGDDFSVIVLSHQDAFVGWGQWPAPAGSGNQAGYFSAIKLQAFNHD